MPGTSPAGQRGRAGARAGTRAGGRAVPASQLGAVSALPLLTRACSVTGTGGSGATANVTARPASDTVKFTTAPGLPSSSTLRGVALSSARRSGTKSCV